jgi:hypothetical protein
VGIITGAAAFWPWHHCDMPWLQVLLLQFS